MDERDMDRNPPRKRGGGAFITFLLVLIILLLSAALIYLRYGDLIMNRLYQFTDGKIGAETGVTSLPGRVSGALVDDGGASDALPGDGGASDTLPGDGGASDTLPGDDGASDALPGGGASDTLTDGGEPAPVEEQPPAPPELDYDAANALPEGLTLSASDFTIRTLGESVTIRVTGGSDGPFTWVSENPAVAQVDASGKITAQSHGTVKVIVTDGVRKGTCIARMITGSTSSAAKLNTTDFTRTIEEGPYQLRVTGVEAPITWTTENAAVATVDADGVVTPVAKGRTQIRAAWDGGYLICVVRVPG